MDPRNTGKDIVPITTSAADPPPLSSYLPGSSTSAATDQMFQFLLNKLQAMEEEQRQTQLQVAELMTARSPALSAPTQNQPNAALPVIQISEDTPVPVSAPVHYTDPRVTIVPPKIPEPYNLWANSEASIPRGMKPCTRPVPPIEVPYYDPYYHPPSVAGEEPKNDDMNWIKEELRNLRQEMKAVKDTGIDLAELSLFPEARLPDGFQIPPLVQFEGKGTEDPKSHIKAYVRTLQLCNFKEPELAQLFHHSLTGYARKWFLELKPQQISTWRDVVTEFCEKFANNEGAAVTRRRLEMTRQGEKESFAEFVARWRELASQMDECPKEEELVEMVIKCFRPNVQQLMGVSYIPHFKALLYVGAQVEDELARRAENDESSSQYSKKVEVAAIHQVQSYTTYPSQPTPISPGWASTDCSASTKKPPRKFSHIPSSLSEAFEKLKEDGLLYPMHPRPLPNPIPQKWDMTKHCDFHQGPGHHTNNCITLRNVIQDLIDKGTIAPHNV